MTNRIRRLLRRRIDVLLVAWYPGSKLEPADRSALKLAQRLLADESTSVERLVKATVYLDGIYKKHWPTAEDIDSMPWYEVEEDTIDT